MKEKQETQEIREIQQEKQEKERKLQRGELHYNAWVNRLLTLERKEKKISREQLSVGILGRNALLQMERQSAGWRKEIGDVLLHRMGIPLEYLEETVTAEELERWRAQEEIGVWILRDSRKAARLLEAYEKRSCREISWKWKRTGEPHCGCCSFARWI